MIPLFEVLSGNLNLRGDPESTPEAEFRIRPQKPTPYIRDIILSSKP